MLLIPCSSPHVPNATGEAWVKALQKQIDGDFAPHWSLGETLQWVGDSTTVQPQHDDRVIRIVPSSNDPGALGSHWLADTVPTGEVGVDTCLSDGVDPSSCLSHEILELIYDPFAILAFQVGRFFLSAEVCDRVEGSDPAYKIDGVTVENFSLPAAFTGAGGFYDFRHVLTSNVLTPNGYQLQVDIGSGQWTQICGKLGVRAAKRKASPNSRRAKRMKRAGADPHSLMLVAPV